MARMTLRAVHADDERRQLPLSERIVDENLGSYCHVSQPRQRQRCAPLYAATSKVRSADLDDAPHGDDPEDAAWLYAWASADLRRPAAESLDTHVIADLRCD